MKPAAASRHHRIAEAEVELADEFSVHPQDPESLGGDNRCHGGEHGQGRQRHHVTGHLQHDVGDLLHPVDDDAGPLAKGRRSGTEEHRKDHDLQDFVVRHRLEYAPGHQVRHEFLERERRHLQVGRCASVGQRQVQRIAGPEDIDQDHAEDQRYQRRTDEPTHGLQTDASDGLGVSHVRDADDQRGKYQRRDDHLDQPQEDIGEQRDVTGSGLRGFRRREQLVAHPAHADTCHHRNENPGRQFHGNAPLDDRRRRPRSGWPGAIPSPCVLKRASDGSTRAKQLCRGLDTRRRTRHGPATSARRRSSGCRRSWCPAT